MALNKLWIIFGVGIVMHLPVSGQETQSGASEKLNLYPTETIVSRYHNNWTQKHYAQRIKAFINDPLAFGEIVFIGNSITEQGRNWAEKFEMPHIRNRGISGDVTDGVLKRLTEITYYKPKAVFILIGVNDLFSMHHNEDNRHSLTYDLIVPSVAHIAQNIGGIVQEIHLASPDTKVFVRTILPTRRAYLKDDILSLNELIKAEAKNGGYQVIDFYTQFVDDNGELQKKLTTDGVHLNAAGYERWVTQEKPILKGL